MACRSGRVRLVSRPTALLARGGVHRPHARRRRPRHGRCRMGTAILVRNEFIKTRRRTAFWVASLVFTGLMSLIFGSMFMQGLRKPERAFILPGAWGEILGGPGVLASFFSAIVVILLVSSEFTWRTSRQNVIDGLSKEEFFGAKLPAAPRSLAPLLRRDAPGRRRLLAGWHGGQGNAGHERRAGASRRRRPDGRSARRAALAGHRLPSSWP